MATTVYGQDIYDAVIARLGGYSNAITDVNKILSAINDGTAEVWAVLKSLDLEFFVEDSQNSTSTADDYFATLTTSAREFTLPVNCREVRAIECTTGGYEKTRFEYRPLSDNEFQTTRRVARASGSGSGLVNGTDAYLYTILGARTIQFAQFPEAAFSLVIWYVKALNDIDLTTEISEILHPYSKKIVEYALQILLLSLQDQQMSEAWMDRWRNSVRTLAMAAPPRDSTGPIFIQAYEGN